jgi:hypothetical protein
MENGNKRYVYFICNETKKVLPKRAKLAEEIRSPKRYPGVDQTIDL